MFLFLVFVYFKCNTPLLCVCTLFPTDDCVVPIEESTLKIESQCSGKCVSLQYISPWMGMCLCLLFAIFALLRRESICVFFYLQCLFSLDRIVVVSFICNICSPWMGMYLCLFFTIFVFLGKECICVFYLSSLDSSNSSTT